MVDRCSPTLSTLIGSNPFLIRLPVNCQECFVSFTAENWAKRLPLFDFQSGGESVGLDEVFVTLSTLDFRELQAILSETKRLSAEEIRELASKTWSER